MKNIKTFEGFFNFGKKKETTKRMNAKEFIDYTISNYKEMFNRSQIFDVDVNDNRANVAWIKDFKIGCHKYHVSLSTKNGFVLADFLDNNGKELINDIGDKTNDTEISEADYNKYLKSLKEIDDYIYNIEVDKEKKSVVSANSDGDISNINVNDMDMANMIIDDHMSSHVGKEYIFDVSYVKWLFSDKNERHLEEISLKVTEFKIDLQFNENKPSFYGKIFVTCPINNESYYIPIFPSYKPEWVDLNDFKIKYDKGLRISPEKRVSNVISRRENRKESSYPSYQLMDVCPSKYNTIEMINEFLQLLTEVNNLPIK